MAKPNQLQKIAQEMRDGLATQNRGWTMRPLAHGLKIVLARIDGQWRLALAREKSFPSDIEVQLCMAAFNVPEGAEPVKVTKPVRSARNGQPIDHGVVEMKWREL